MVSPLKAILDIKRRELPLALLMFGYFFLVITTFWIIKPIKKSLFLGYYNERTFDIFGASFSGPDAELIAKVANMGVAFLAVIAFTRLARNLRRQQLTYVFSLFCAACTAAFIGIASSASEATAWLFYLYGDLFNTLMVATFFAFLNDSFSPESAKRNYGVIVLGGVAGGAFGTSVVKHWISDLSLNEWLWITMAAIALIVVLAAMAAREVMKNPPPEAPSKAKEPSKSNAAVEGARLVFRSRYLLAIVVMVGLYEVVSTILDYQFSRTVVSLAGDKKQIGEHFATIFMITNFVSLGVQLFLTSVIMTRLGVHVALLIMPVAIVGMSVGFLILPILWIGSFLNTADNALNYSINQSARESLYTPTSRDEKYKAKAFIDMFVQRFAKALAVGVSLLMSKLFGDSVESLRYLSIIVVLLVVGWTLAALFAGRRFEELEAAQMGPPERR